MDDRVEPPVGDDVRGPLSEEPLAPPMIFPPVEPETADAMVLEPQPQPVAEAFAGLDPQLITQSIEATAATPAAVVPTRTQEAGALWRDWLSSRRMLLLVAVLLFLISLPRLTQSVVEVLSADLFAGLLALIVWAAYAFPLIWLINRFEFFERESSMVIALALAWGGVIASSMAVTANQAMFSLFTSALGAEFTAQWGAALGAPTTEESLKAIGIVAVALLARRGIRSAIDGFVIGAILGLGFQVVENFVYTGNLLISGVDENPIQTIFNVLLVRGIGSGLWSHAAYSGVAGMGIGYALTRTDRSMTRRLLVAFGLLGVAWLMHFVWNFPVPADAGGGAWSVIKAMVILGLLLLVVLRSEGRESYVYTDYLASLHDPAIVTPEEIEQLRTYRSREEAVRQVARTGGDRAAAALRMLQRAQADLSVAMANGDIAEVSTAQRTIASARARVSAVAIMPDEAGHAWGVAAIWAAAIGVVLPLIGPSIAAVLAWIGTREAKQAGVRVADSIRTAWVVTGVSLVIGLILVWVLAP